MYFQVNFSYVEAGENKQALVKLVTCERWVVFTQAIMVLYCRAWLIFSNCNFIYWWAVCKQLCRKASLQKKEREGTTRKKRESRLQKEEVLISLQKLFYSAIHHVLIKLREASTSFAAKELTVSISGIFQEVTMTQMRSIRAKRGE